MAEAKIKAIEMPQWNAIAASTRGASHSRSGLPNQDACDYWLSANHNAAVLTVSDGHGSGRHFRSQYGSQLGVAAAIALLREFIARQESHYPQESDVHELPRRIVEQWLANVAAHFAQNPFTEDELRQLKEEDSAAAEVVVANPPIAYGATLLAVAAVKDWVLYLQLGDGDILVVNDAGETTRPLPEDSRLVGNQTTSLCQPEAWNEFRARLVHGAAESPAVVLLSSDGYSNSFRSEEDFLLIGRDYLAMVRDRGLHTVKQELPAILEEASKQGSGDDITLGILQRGSISENPRPAQPSAKTQALEQLKKDYVAQQQKLNDLESSHRHASKSLRRMQWVLGIVALCAGSYVAAYLWKPWSSTPPVLQGQKSKEPITGSLSIPHPWTLNIGSGDIELTVNSKITAKQLGLKKDKEIKDKEDDPVAEVVSTKKGLGLKNLSKQEWTITPAGGKADKNPANSIVPLQDGMKIDFGGGISGTIYSGHDLQTLQAPRAH